MIIQLASSFSLSLECFCRGESDFFGIFELLSDAFAAFVAPIGEVERAGVVFLPKLGMNVLTDVALYLFERSSFVEKFVA